MRKPTDFCMLCQKEHSTKRNSHLIPKFLGNGIFEGSKPRQGILINRYGRTSRIQDTFKEDYILCDDCEKGISIFETYCSLRLERFNNIRFCNQFKHNKIGNFEYVDCMDINNKIFNLLIYSIIWRVSISQKDEFGALKLNVADEENLRLKLNNFITKSQSELFEKLDGFKHIPNHSHVLIRPNKKLRPPGSMLAVASNNDFVHQLFIVDYLLFYITDSSLLVSEFKMIDNNMDRNTRLGIANSERWKNFNKNTLRDYLKFDNFSRQIFI